MVVNWLLLLMMKVATLSKLIPSREDNWVSEMVTLEQVETVAAKLSCCIAGRVVQLITPISVNSGNDKVERTVRSVRVMVPVIEFISGAERVTNEVALFTVRPPSSC